MIVNVKRLNSDAVMPKYMTAGAACFDLVASDNGSRHHNCHSSSVYGTGLAFEIPEGHVMLIFSRSGHGFNNAMRLSNCVGVIDSDYRGEVRVSLRSDGIQKIWPIKGDRIAQAMIIPVPYVTLVPADSLSNTERGDSGFGSTGDDGITESDIIGGES